jgi:hypothetical protein
MRKNKKCAEFGNDGQRQMNAESGIENKQNSLGHLPSA